MDDTRSLRRFRALPYSPLPDLIRARGEEAAQLHTLPHRGDDLRQRAHSSQLLRLLLSLSLGLEPRETLFERDRQQDDRITGRVCLDPLGDLW